MEEWQKRWLANMKVVGDRIGQLRTVGGQTEAAGAEPTLSATEGYITLIKHRPDLVRFIALILARQPKGKDASSGTNSCNYAASEAGVDFCHCHPMKQRTALGH